MEKTIMTGKILRSLQLVLIAVVFMFGMVGSPAIARANLIYNGGFELPGIFDGTQKGLTSIPGWRLSFVGSNNYMKLHRNYAGRAHTGQQLMELDSGKTNKINQDITTTPGRTYRLTFAFSARPTVPDNKLNVKWRGSTIAQLSKNGAGLTDTRWQVYSYEVKAISTKTLLSFDNLNELADGQGAFLDSVSLVEIDRTFIANIDSTMNLSPETGAKYVLPAGAYTVSIIGQQEGGKYDAWNRNGTSVTGCDTAGKNCTKGWEHKYFYKIGDSKQVAVDRTGRYQTPQLALANAPADVSFTLTEESEVSFFVTDTGDTTNNIGGVSLLISRQ
ncbi:MAG: DUF642 domain-containing protein [Cyanobacteria bacterium SBLK]|nr:DUF642 domain-containing protein [Cyanobacteria bacterium SBLK]